MVYRVELRRDWRMRLWLALRPDLRRELADYIATVEARVNAALPREEVSRMVMDLAVCGRAEIYFPNPPSG